MTAPTEQKGLFEQISEILCRQFNINNCFETKDIEAICAEFEQRLADAEQICKSADQIWCQQNETNRKLSEQLASAHQEACDQTNIACQALAEVESVRADAARMNWLEFQYVQVRTPLVYGSRENFITSSDESDGEIEKNKIRQKIDAAMKAAPQ